MQTFELRSFLNGMAIAFYIIAFLMSGLQLCFKIFHGQHQSVTLISRWLGSILLGFAITAVMYVISIVVPEWKHLEYIETGIDFILMSLMGCCGYIIYANQKPPLMVMIRTIFPYLLVIILAVAFPVLENFAYDAVMLILISQYVYYALALYQHEKQLDDYYADPESHSLSWLRGASFLYLFWWGGHSFCLHADAMDYYNVVVCTSAAVMILYVSVRINNYAMPVSLETRKNLETPDSEEQKELIIEKTEMIRISLMKLYEQEQVYLNPELTIEDVALRLETDSKYLSGVLNKEMNTTFYKFTNDFRVRRAKELLENSDEKIIQVALQSGFNSPQTFSRTFMRITGKSPSEWRGKIVLVK